MDIAILIILIVSWMHTTLNHDAIIQNQQTIVDNQKTILDYLKDKIK